MTLMTALSSYSTATATAATSSFSRNRAGDNKPILNMFEIVLSTIENKLQRVENLDRAVHHLMRKMDIMERKLSAKDAEIMTAIQALEKETHEAHVSVKLNQLSAKLDSLCTIDRGGTGNLEQDLEEQDILVAQPSNRKLRVLQDNAGVAGVAVEAAGMEDVKEVISGIDRRLGVHINIVSENLGKMAHMVEEVRDALLDDPEPQSPNGRPKQWSKFDKLLSSIHPLIVVKEKVDEVHGMLAGTKFSVDHLLPRSDELLSQTQRQERAISHIHDDLRHIERELHITKLGQFAGNATMPETETLPNLVPTPFSSEPIAMPLIDNLARNSNEANTTRGPSVVFPSIQNKPIVANSSFVTYKYGKNKLGVEGYSCADLYRKGLRRSGTYYLQIQGTRFWYLKVFCDMETDGGGWMVMQRRDDYGEPRQSFNQNWQDYKYGFGDPDQEVWLGNENIHLLTNSEDYELMVELVDFEGNIRHAYYDFFKLGSEDNNFRLEIGGFHGNAGDSLNDPWYGANLRPFSTYDKDNDRSSLNCASMLKGGWWWKSCGRGLNGLYLTDPQDLTARQGVVWFRWKGWDYSLKRSQMMIRPKSLSTKTKT